MSEYVKGRRGRQGGRERDDMTRMEGVTRNPGGREGRGAIGASERGYLWDEGRNAGYTMHEMSGLIVTGA